VTSPLYILFDPVVDAPPRGEQEVKDEAFEMSKDLALISGYDIMSDEFVEAYQNLEGILLRAEKYRSHLFFLSLYAVKHLLTNGSIHLAHPDDPETAEDVLEFTRDALEDAANSLVEMLTQILFFKENETGVFTNEKFEKMPDYVRKVLFTFAEDDEEEV
jgi:hypothetical protein